MNSNTSTSIDKENEFKAWLVNAAYMHTPLLLICQLISASVMAYVLWQQQINPKFIFSWMTLILIGIVAHWALSTIYRRSAPRPEQSHVWQHWLNAVLAFSVLLWGIIALWVLPDLAFVYHVLGALLMLGMAASFMVLLATMRTTYLAILLGLLLPIIMLMVRGASEVEYILGLALLANIALLWQISYRAHVSILSQFHVKMQLDQLMYEDKLTGLANRAQFENMLENEWRRGLRNKTSLAMLLIDIDYFKAYNEFYGRDAGDQCIQLLANALKNELARPADFIARLHGGQFVVMLPETSWQGAVTMAENLHKAAAILRIPHAYSDTIPCISVTIGVATRGPQNHIAAKTLFVAADEGLYEGKRNGRNQVAWKNKYQALSNDMSA